MGYYVRAFCTAPHPPPLATVLEWLRRRFRDVAIESDDLQAPDWTEAEIRYSPGRLPIPVECNRDDGTPDNLCRAEIAEFVERVGPSKSPRVQHHLGATRYIVACQLLSDIDDLGYNVNGSFLEYFVQNGGGMIQADGEGFYEGDRVLLPLK